jgi:hypothetical protein
VHELAVTGLLPIQPHTLQLSGKEDYESFVKYILLLSLIFLLSRNHILMVPEVEEPRITIHVDTKRILFSMPQGYEPRIQGYKWQALSMLGWHQRMQ